MITLGKTKFIMWATVVTVLINIGLNLSLIPILGINGAAIATMAAYVIQNLLIYGRLYQKYRIQPFTIDYIKPAVVAGITLAITYLFVKFALPSIPVWSLPLFLLLFIVVYGGSILITRSISKEDINILLTLEKRLGINLTFIKKILGRFI
jgi:O-antigen/teichoic acid export membrane protein